MNARLSMYGGRIIETDGIRTVEMIDPNDNARTRHQYRIGGAGLERRHLTAFGQSFRDTGSPWERIPDQEIAQMYAVRGQYHPILDELGLDPSHIMARILGARGGHAQPRAAKVEGGRKGGRAGKGSKKPRHQK